MQSLYIIAHWKVRKHWLLKTTNCTYNRINSSNSITVSLMIVKLLCMHAVIYNISKNLSFLLDILCIFKFRTIETTILIDTCTCINIWCTCIWLARKSIYLILIPKGWVFKIETWDRLYNFLIEVMNYKWNLYP